MIHVQNVTLAYPGLEFPGIGFYADRAMVLPGVLAIVPKAAISAKEEYNYFRSVGIGTDDVLEVDMDPKYGIYPALAQAPVREKILQKIEEGHRLCFFNTREGCEDVLVDQLGLSWHRHIASIPVKLADQANDKAAVRQLAGKLGHSGLFPVHQVLYLPTLAEIFDAIEKVGGYGQVIIKLNNSATAQGTLVPKSEADVQKWYDQYQVRIDRVVVEEYLGDHHSITTAARLDNGRVVDRWYSYQVMEFNSKTGEFNHLHSVVGDHPLLDDDTKRQLTAMSDLLDSWFIEQDAAISGIFNWDGAFTVSGRVKLLEANFRMGQSTMLRAIQNQIEDHKQREVTCLWGKVRPSRAADFSQLRRDLGSLLWDGERISGVIPMITRCLKFGYCHLVAVGQDLGEAQMAWQDAVLAINR